MTCGMVAMGSTDGRIDVPLVAIGSAGETVI
jgi:hypothetical protein